MALDQPAWPVGSAPLRGGACAPACYCQHTCCCAQLAARRWIRQLRADACRAPVPAAQLPCLRRIRTHVAAAWAQVVWSDRVWSRDDLLGHKKASALLLSSWASLPACLPACRLPAYCNRHAAHSCVWGVVKAPARWRRPELARSCPTHACDDALSLCLLCWHAGGVGAPAAV